MVANGFTPETLSVQEGETIRFVFANRDTVFHEALFADEETQDRHGQHHAGGHGEAARVEVSPGQSAELAYSFERAGSLLIGCHEPGHWEAGMKAVITVSRAST